MYSTPDKLQDINRALLEISMGINSHLDLTTILSKVVTYTCQLINCEDASIMLWNPRLNQFEKGASTTKAGTTVSKRIRSEKGASRWIMDHGKVVIVKDIYHDPFTINPMTLEGGIRAYAGFPLQAGEDNLGVLYALSHTPRSFEFSEIETMQNLANMAALSIKNASMVERLQELNEFKEGMMSMAAHDLRSPLGLAAGYAALLEETIETPDEVQQKCIDVIHKAHDRMDDMITGILDYGRLTSVDQIEKQPVEVNALVREGLTNFSTLAEQKNHRLHANLLPENVFVLGDQLLLQEALGNLISNAVKYTPPDGEISLNIGRSDDTVFVAVQDSGVGIKAQEIDKLFQPFVRLSSAGREKGTGLGLSLVKMIIDRHQGQIAVDSQPDFGTTFTIYLPELEE